MKKLFYSTFFLGFLFLMSCNHSSENAEILIKGEAQGSTYHIKYIGKQIPQLKSEIDSILEVIDVSMSTYREDSDISKINRGEEVKVDDHFKKVFEMSQKIWQQTDGLFDPTVGVLVEAWGFGNAHKHQKVSQSEVDSLLTFVGFDKVELTTDQIIRKKQSQLRFDFNAIAQGYSVDVVADFLKSKGIENFIVEIGGELYLSGKNTLTNEAWTVGIDNPLQSPDERTLIAVVKLSNKGMATSGNYRKVWTDPETGQQFVHTINPKTGYTQPSNVLSVTVIADTAMAADGYATAFMVMGLEKGKEFLKKHPELEVYINYSEDNELKSFATQGFEEYMVSEEL